MKHIKYISHNDTPLTVGGSVKIRLLAVLAASAAAIASLTVTGLAAPFPPEPSAPATPEAHISREIVTETFTVPHSSRIVFDDAKYSDESELTEAGHDGLGEETYVVILTDGVETERYPIRRVELIAPVDAVTTVGSIPGSKYDSRGYYIWPTTGVITSGYGRRSVSVGSSNHKGLDIGTPTGTEVLAADGGEVIYAQDSGKSGYGNLVKLRHDNGAVTYYAHLSEIKVSVGDRVAQGDVIALSGATGIVTGPHLHFEIRPDGETPANPASYLEGKPEKT